MQSIIARALDEDEYVGMASLDLSSAFDVVDIDLLLKRLRVIGLPSDMVALIGTWLRKGKFYVEANGQTSTFLENKYGRVADAVGHSLGGRLIENSGSHGNVITYNKAIGLGDIGKTFKNNQVDIRTNNDVVSGLTNLQTHNVETVKQKVHSLNPFQEVYNAHDVDNLFPNAITS